MRRHIDHSSNSAYAVAIIIDIISRIIFVCASVVLIYWLMKPFLLSMGIGIPGVISVVCEKPYGLANMVGYSYHGGWNFAGGIAALLLFVLGGILEYISYAIERR